MSAKKAGNCGAETGAVNIKGRQSAMSLGVEKVSIHKNGIEFHSLTPFPEWSEMTVNIEPPSGGGRLSCHGVVVSCVGSRHSGYNVSMLFTALTPHAERRIGAMARSAFGAG